MPCLHTVHEVSVTVIIYPQWKLDWVGMRLIKADHSEPDPSRTVVKTLMAILTFSTGVYLHQEIILFALRASHNWIWNCKHNLCSRVGATCFPTSTISFTFSKSLPACTCIPSVYLLDSCLSPAHLQPLPTAYLCLSACHLVLPVSLLVPCPPACLCACFHCLLVLSAHTVLMVSLPSDPTDLYS